MSQLVEHATRELERCGQTEEDRGYAASLIAAITAFASYGHSGGSAMCAIDQLNILLRFGVLSPITDDPDEWHDVGEMSGMPLWQNRRQSSIFSIDCGKTFYILDREPIPPGADIPIGDYQGSDVYVSQPYAAAEPKGQNP